MFRLYALRDRSRGGFRLAFSCHGTDKFKEANRIIARNEAKLEAPVNDRAKKTVSLSRCSPDNSRVSNALTSAYSQRRVGQRRVLNLTVTVIECLSVPLLAFCSSLTSGLSLLTMADVFDDNAPVIVDGDVLEAAKENIQPLAAGRRVTALAGILSTPHAQREGRLAAARTRHRMNVEIALEDEDDDPLEAYSRFVYWTVENYPQGHSAESGLLELLEEATRALKDDRDGKWRDDLRYLKLWVLYATYVEKPAIIYKFLEVNEIGTSHALLYEEFATVLERAGR